MLKALEENDHLREIAQQHFVLNNLILFKIIWFTTFDLFFTLNIQNNKKYLIHNPLNDALIV